MSTNPQRRRNPRRRRARSESQKYFYDQNAAELAVAFFPTFLEHVKGKWARRRERFELMPWQADRIIRPLFGQKRTSDGTRRYRVCYVEVPRKNGKSALGAGLVWLMLLGDDEYGPEIYSLGRDKNQAALIFKMAKSMRARSKALRRRTEAHKWSITYPACEGSYEPLPGDAESKHGLNASCGIVDENGYKPR